MYKIRSKQIFHLKNIKITYTWQMLELVLNRNYNLYS